MKRFDADTLHDTLTTLFTRAGATPEVADSTARILVEGDLLGHHTHGVKLARGYLKDMQDGHATGDHTRLEIHDKGSIAALFDGHYILGPWLMERALARCRDSARHAGLGIVTIRRAHHIACLAAYLQPLVEANLVPVIMSSDPANASVAPFGGLTPVYSPNPLAIGIPGRHQPMLIDVSMSTLANGTVARARRNGERLPYPAILDAEGRTSDDPEDYFRPPGGSILPLGELAFGHKGFALGLAIEALTSALGGYGRKDTPTGAGASVTVMVIDPARFGGAASFLDETDHLTRRCLNAGEREAGRPVRLPGQAGLARRRDYLENGIPLPEDALETLQAAIADASLTTRLPL